VRRIEVLRTAAFRTAALAACAFGATMLLLFGFIYWQTAGLETGRINQMLVHESLAMARERPDAVLEDVRTRYARDLHRQIFAAVFDAGHRRLSGDVTAYPAGLAADGVPALVVATRESSAGPLTEAVRAVASVLPGGRILVLCRSDRELATLRVLVLRALWLGLVPALLASLAIGAFASLRTIARVREVNGAIARIMQGHLDQRLPWAGGEDAFAQLSGGVNRMLDEIERLMHEMRGVGDDIAHDLRTPLSRLRARLENGRAHAASLGELGLVVDQAIGDLDQAFVLITALLRIGQIEGSARRAGFGRVDLSVLAAEAMELYAPVAEMRGIALSGDFAPGMVVEGDRDLLFEAVANVLDNAVKFTPDGGAVTLRSYAGAGGPVLAVRDTGPGIAESERGAVLQRFRRGDRSRSVPGYGLGLSLVSAIMRLHVFELRLADAGPGLVVEMRSWVED
jgi:signal transduction histidine kinase